MSESAARNSADQTLTKANIIDRLTGEIGLNRREAREIVGQFFEEICSALEGEQSVRISGFGNFLLRHKRERLGRNPVTRQAVTVSARRVVTFAPGQKLKRRIAVENEVSAEDLTELEQRRKSSDQAV